VSSIDGQPNLVLRQPQGRAHAPPVADHGETAEDVLRLGAPPGRTGWAPVTNVGCFPLRCSGPPVHSAHHRVASPGRSGSGWRRSGIDSEGSAPAGSLFHSTGASIPYALRHSYAPTPTPMPEFRRRAEGVDGPPLRPNHYGLLPDQPEEEAQASGRWALRPRRLRQTAPSRTARLGAGPCCALRELHEPSNIKSAAARPVRSSAPDVASTDRILIPARHRRACGQPAEGILRQPRHRCRDLREGQSRRPDRRPAPRWPRHEAAPCLSRQRTNVPRWRRQPGCCAAPRCPSISCRRSRNADGGTRRAAALVAARAPTAVTSGDVRSMPFEP